MTDNKLKRACNAFAEKECANNFDGWCVPKDCPCFVYEPNGWVCTWFLNAVVPLNDVLQASIMRKLGEATKDSKKCDCCGNAFIPASNRQRYCADCAKEIYRIANARRVRKYRSRHRM